MTTHRLRSVVHPGDRTKDALVTEVNVGTATTRPRIIGANVWRRNGQRYDHVFVRVEDLESVGRELLRLAEEWKKS